MAKCGQPISLVVRNGKHVTPRVWSGSGLPREKRVYTTTMRPLFSRSVARPRGHRAKKTMVYTIFLGKQGERVYSIGPERRVYTIEPQTRKKKKRRVSTVVVHTFFFPVCCLITTPKTAEHKRHPSEVHAEQTDPVWFKWGFGEGLLKDKFALSETYNSPVPQRRQLLAKHPFSQAKGLF